MATEAVIFDVDGTLVDSVDLHARAWQQAFAHFGHRISFEGIRAQIGKGGDQLMPVFLSQDELSLKGETIEAFRAGLWKGEYLKQVRAFPGVRELFQALLRRGLRIALASSAKGDEVEIYKQIARIDDLIETETSADDARRSKPHPDIFSAALRRLPGVGKDRALVVGDTPWDAIAARRLGVRAAGVLCGGFAEEDLLKAGCMAIYRDPEDLQRRLDEPPFAGD